MLLVQQVSPTKGRYCCFATGSLIVTATVGTILGGFNAVLKWAFAESRTTEVGSVALSKVRAFCFCSPGTTCDATKEVCVFHRSVGGRQCAVAACCDWKTPSSGDELVSMAAASARNT